jgi:tetratricopeptide (TPR) repeat protein
MWARATVLKFKLGLPLVCLAFASSAIAQTKPATKSNGTVGEMLKGIDSRTKRLNIQKSSNQLPQTDKLKVPSKKELEKVEPPKSSSLMAQSQNKGREVENLTDQSIQQLYGLTQKFRSSSRRGELWLRLAELYVEKSRLVESRIQAQYQTVSEEAIKQNRQPPPINLKPALEYNLKAIQLYEWFLRDFPKDPKVDKALFFLGYNNFEVGQVEKGKNYYQQLTKNYPGSQYILESHFALGEFYFENEKWREALPYYQKVAGEESSPLQAFALYKLAWSQYKTNQAKPALANLERVIAMGRRKAAQDGESAGVSRIRLGNEAMKDLVQFYGMTGEHTNAKQYFERLAGEAAAEKMVEQLAYYYIDSGQREAARNLFNSIVKQSPTNPKAYDYQYQLVQLYLAVGDNANFKKELFVWIENYGPTSTWAKANAKDTELLEKSAQLMESTLRNYVLQAHQTAQNSKTETSRKLAKEGYEAYFNFFKTGPNQDEMRFFYGELLYEVEEYSKAAASYAWLLENSTSGKYREKASLNSLLSLEKELPSPEEIKKIIGNTIQPIEFDIKIKRFETISLKYFAEYPKGENVLAIKYRLGSLYYYYNQFDKAVNVFWDVIKENPKSQYAEYSSNLILDVYNLKKDYAGLDKAADELLKMPNIGSGKLGEQIRSVKERSAFKQAQDSQGTNDLVKAAQNFEEFAKNNPKSPLAITAIFNAAVNYEKGNQLMPAVRNYRKISALTSKEHLTIAAQSKKSLPGIFEKLGQYELAAQHFQSYAVEYPSDANAAVFHYNAAVIQDGLNQVAPAVKNYQIYLKNSKSKDRFEVNYILGELYERVGQTSNAISAFDAYSKGSVSNPRRAIEAIYRIGKMHLKNNNRAKAFEAFNRVVNAQKKMGNERSVGVSYAAEAQYHLVHPIFEEFVAIRIPKDPAAQGKAVQQKLALSNRLRENLKKVIGYDDGPMIVASLALQGRTLQSLAESILKAPIPGNLKPQELEEYKKGVQNLANPFLLQAKEALQSAVKKGFEVEAYNEYLKSAFEDLNGGPVPQALAHKQHTFNVQVFDLLIPFATHKSPKVEDKIYSALQEAMNAKDEKRVENAAAIALESNPEDLLALNALAIVHHSKKRVKLAELIWQRALKAHKDNPALLNNLAVLDFANGEWRRALATLKEIKAKNSSYQEAELNLSSLYVQHYDFKKAQSLLAKAARQYPLSSKESDSVAVRVHTNLAVALWGLGKTKDAESVLTDIFKQDIANPQALLNLANLLVYVEKNKDKATTVVSRLKYMSEDPTLQKRVKELENLVYAKDGA